MDQNTPRDDASGAQPPADPASSDASAWNQQEQAAAPDPSQAAAGGPQEAQTEHAAWSADASYQQQQQQAAAQGQQADTQAYAAPEPQSATYSEQPADQQAYAQQPQQQAYDQQAYAQQPQQQAYDQQAYAQQQQAYDQQAYQQQPQQQAYDQQAYAQQQQQAYDQQQQPQQQAYDQQANQQQYYDQTAYGQQPSYYDQQAYAQQQYQQQQPGYQQPTQPYAYGQPVQQQPWPGEEPYWDQQATGYGRSFMAVLGAFALLTWGLVFAIGGALILWLGALDVTDLNLSTAMLDIVDEFNKQATGYGGILLILGIMQMIGAMGILAHRKWGRAFGIVLGLLGTLWGVALLISSITFDAGDVTVEGAFSGEAPALGAAILILVSYLIVFLGMFMGRRHFRKKGVSS